MENVRKLYFCTFSCVNFLTATYFTHTYSTMNHSMTLSSNPIYEKITNFVYKIYGINIVFLIWTIQTMSMNPHHTNIPGCQFKCRKNLAIIPMFIFLIEVLELHTKSKTKHNLNIQAFSQGTEICIRFLRVLFEPMPGTENISFSLYFYSLKAWEWHDKNTKAKIRNVTTVTRTISQLNIMKNLCIETRFIIVN